MRMQVENHFQLDCFVLIQFLDGLFGSMNGGMNVRACVCPMTIQILTEEVPSRVSHIDPVGIHDGNHLKNNVFPEVLCNIVVTD